MQLRPIATNFTLKDDIYDTLRDAIMAMNIYDEGASLRLDERSIAEQLGISRTPLREALARLEKDSLVHIAPRRGVLVVRKTLDEILEMIVAWAALELMALRKHAMRHSPDSARADLGEYSDANIRFHQMILEMSGWRTWLTGSSSTCTPSAAARWAKTIARVDRSSTTCQSSRRLKLVIPSFPNDMSANTRCACTITFVALGHDSKRY